MVMFPHQYFRSDMSFRMSNRVTATVVCCILKQILYVISQKKLQLLADEVPQTPYRGSAPGPCWGTLSPRSPTGAPPLDTARVPRPPVFFYVPPNNPVRSTPLLEIVALGDIFVRSAVYKSSYLLTYLHEDIYSNNPH